MTNQFTLKVYPRGSGRSIYRIITISGGAKLDKLCGVILDAFNFSHDHLYEFCMNNKMYEWDNYQSNPDRGEPSTKIALNELGLVEKQVFSLHYDFGDDWMFSIKVEKIEEVEKVGKPEIVMAKGEVIQYPDYEEDWDEEADEYLEQ